MKPSEALAANRATIRRHVVESYQGRNARVFGSVLRGQDTDSSDLDILIDPTPETTLFDIGSIRHELGKLLGVPVDVLTPHALPDRFRNQVLAEARSAKAMQTFKHPRSHAPVSAARSCARTPADAVNWRYPR